MMKNIRNHIDNAGRKKVIFVEGYDDKILFEILYDENLDRIAFIDVSNGGEGSGGCLRVKKYVEDMVLHLRSEEKYFGIIDRDFRTDEELESDIALPEYNNKLYIFRERYTLENYFIDEHILFEFLKDESISNRKILFLIDKENPIDLKKIIQNILKKLIPISAANWTLLKYREKFITSNIGHEEHKIILQIIRVLKDQIEEDEIKEIYKTHKQYITKKEKDLQKYISGKYFFYQLYCDINEKGKERCNKEVKIPFMKNFAHLARIMKAKDKNLPQEFEKIKEFLSIN